MNRAHSLQHGFAAIAAIFLVVILAAMGAFMVSFSNTQQLTSAQDVQGTRAYWAARAGLEWGVGSVLDCANTPATCTRTTTTTQLCPAATPTTCRTSPYDLTTSFDGNYAVRVSWNIASYSESPPEPTATANRYIFQFTSVATTGTVGTIGYVERSVSASMECMRNGPKDGVAYVAVTDPLTYSCG
jgi:MSHA biogenesis protein MshP